MRLRSIILYFLILSALKKNNLDFWRIRITASTKKYTFEIQQRSASSKSSRKAAVIALVVSLNRGKEINSLNRHFAQC